MVATLKNITGQLLVLKHTVKTYFKFLWRRYTLNTDKDKNYDLHKYQLILVT